MQYNIAVFEGDGIGPDIMKEAKKCLARVAELYNVNLNYVSCIAGDAAYEQYGTPVPEESIIAAKNAHAILFGGINLKSSDPKRNRKTLDTLRRGLQLDINVRPIFISPALHSCSPLKETVIKRGFDIVVYRDLEGGMSANEHYRGIGENGREAFDKEYYTEQIVRKNALSAFALARSRRKRLCHVCKSKILAGSKLWKEILDEIAVDFPDVQLTHMNVDDAAFHISADPSQFDVIIGANTYCDILSDQIAGLTGAVRMYAAENIMPDGKGLYERNQFSELSEGDVGQDVYNPIGMIHAAALMLRNALGLPSEADAIERAVEETLEAGYTTKDIWTEGKILVGTSEMGSQIAARIRI